MRKYDFAGTVTADVHSTIVSRLLFLQACNCEVSVHPYEVELVPLAPVTTRSHARSPMQLVRREPEEWIVHRQRRVTARRARSHWQQRTIRDTRCAKVLR